MNASDYLILSAAVFFTVLILTAAFEKRLIPALSAKAQQPIYQEGPSWHLAKSGTPTMGGIGFVTASTVALVPLCAFFFRHGEEETGAFLLLSLLFALANAAVGILDDLTKIRHRKNEGLTPMQKIFLQSAIGILFLTALARLQNGNTVWRFSFGDVSLGRFGYAVSLFLLLGIVNCANLTDGIDGLAASVAFGIGSTLIVLAAMGNPSVLLIGAVLMGCGLGFLFFNIHPARIFMGDTGSLFLGALTVGGVFSMGNPTLVIPIGAVYVWEGVSVVLQVSVFKLKGKRLFLMAPFHHHLEKRGFSENKICLCALLLTVLGGWLAYLLIRL